MKFKELMKKDNLIAGFVVLGLASCLALVGISCSNGEYKEKETKQEEQVLIPEYVAPTKPQQPEMSDMEKARSLIEPSIKETVGDSEYEILEQNGQLILMFHLSAEDLAYVTEPDWRDLATNAKYAQAAWQDVFRSAGLNVDFLVYIGDINKDEVYLAASNGHILYDVFNEVNDLKIKSF